MTIEPRAKTYTVGDRFFWSRSPAHSGDVVKVGTKWVHVQWEDFGGATWVKKHAPEWLDGMDLHIGDADYTPWQEAS